MARHLSDDVLVDVMDGTAGAGDRAHAESCAQCGARLAEARLGLDLARSAEADEASPLFFEAFPARVMAATEEPPARRPVRWLFAPALLGAAAAAAIAVVVPERATAPVTTAAAATLPAWSALPAGGDDALAALGEAGPVGSELAAEACLDVADCLVSLDDEETGAVAEALRVELGGEL
jgi:hypothetical protein